MSTNPLNDISNVYLKEVFEPQLGKKEKDSSGGKKVVKGQTGMEASAKRIRQAVYDIRYRARREGIELQQAYNQYISHTTMTGQEKTAVKEKLGIGGPVSEEVIGKKYQVRVVPKSGTGKPYVRYASREKINQLRRNPNISSVEMTKYGKPYEGERTAGKQTAAATSGKDWDGDGKVESGAKEYRGVVHNAIQKKKGLKPDGKDTSGVKESYFSWREELKEVLESKIGDSNAQQYQQKIKEKPVNNYAGGKDAVVKINPDFKESVENLGGQIIGVEEINENYLIETFNVATEYFFNQGLNENGLDIVIEELGLEKFTDFVFYIAEDYELIEARRSGRIEPVTKAGKSIGSLKGGAKASAIRAKQKEKAARDKSDDKPSGMTAALRSQSSVAKKITTDKGKKAVEKAKTSQGSKKPVRDAIAKGIFGAVKAYKSGMERHRAATQTAGKALKVAGKAAGEFGKGFASGVKETGTAAKKVKKAVVGEENELQEVAPPGMEGTVKRMKKHKEIDNPYALAWWMKNKGYKSHRKASGAMKEAAETEDPSLSPQQKRKELTKDPLRQQQLQNIRSVMQKELQLQRQKLSLQKQGKLPLSTQEEVELDELTRYAKETGKSARTGKPTSSGGKYAGSDVSSQAMRSVLKSMGSGRAGVQPRGKKKVPGQKPPAAGEYGSGVKSPAQKVAQRRAAAQRAQDAMHSRFD